MFSYNVVQAQRIVITRLEREPWWLGLWIQTIALFGEPRAKASYNHGVGARELRWAVLGLIIVVDARL